MSKNLKELEPESGAVTDLNDGLSASADAVVSARRRQLARLAVGAPVLMTLASRPVLAGQCLSNMMSGNLSNPNRGNCARGRSPGGWGQPGGQVLGYTTAGAWTKAGFSMGVYRPLPTGCSPANEQKFDCYANGTLLTAMGAGALIKDVFPVGTTMLQALNVPYTNQLTRHFIAAYLNASLSENDPNFQYVLTKQQVIAIANGGALPPGFLDVKAFLDSTWT